MKREYLITVLLLAISFVAFAGADVIPPSVANVKVSSDWGKTACASKPGSGITLVLKGSEDKRASQSVGTLKTKKEELEVNLARPAKELVIEAVSVVLRSCGFDVKTKEDDVDAVSASVDVNEFFAGSKKGLVTGETEAKGGLTLHFKAGGGSYDYNLGATKADKRLKKKSIAQLEEVLTSLLESLVTQISETPQLFEEVKKLAERYD